MEEWEGGDLLIGLLSKGHYSERAASSIYRPDCGMWFSCVNFNGCDCIAFEARVYLLLYKSEGGALLKATDFGLSVFIQEGIACLFPFDVFGCFTRNVLLPLVMGKSYRDIVGSAYYVAPEVLKRKYGKEIDIWSAGGGDVERAVVVCTLDTWVSRSSTEAASRVALTNSLEAADVDGNGR
ncbi:calcium-dependent protein kinase 9-like protein [Tanacetum coccineum]